MPRATDLPDVNVWLALSAEDHPHHALAKRYWEQESPSCVAFCRITMLGFLRLVMNPHVMAGKPLKASEAWSLYRQFLNEPGVEFLDEPAGIEDLLYRVSGSDSFLQRRWTDAYLAAFAQSAGFRIVTFDSDFLHFQDIDLQVLTV